MQERGLYTHLPKLGLVISKGGYSDNVHLDSAQVIYHYSPPNPMVHNLRKPMAVQMLCLLHYHPCASLAALTYAESPSRVKQRNSKLLLNNICQYHVYKDHVLQKPYLNIAFFILKYNSQPDITKYILPKVRYNK